MYHTRQTENNQPDNCIQYLDFLRFLAISMVILLHIVSGITDTIASQMTIPQYQVYMIIKNICSCGVPIFLMISGALFLKPSKEISLSLLFKKYIRRIALALLLFGSCFSLMEIIITTKHFSISYIPKAFINMVQGNTWAHMWYLYAILGIYLFLPLLKTFTFHAAKETLGYVCLLLFTCGSLIPFFAQVLHFEIGIIFPISSIYLFYFFVGHYLHSYPLCSKPLAVSMIFLSIVSVIIIVCNQLQFWVMDISYSSPIIIILSVTLFYYCGKIKKVWTICSIWRPYYFSMYLVHTFFLNIAYKFLDITPLLLGGYILIPVFFIMTFLLSLLSAWLMSKIPILKKYVL